MITRKYDIISVTITKEIMKDDTQSEILHKIMIHSQSQLKGDIMVITSFFVLLYQELSNTY